jgi:hypothetical protein
MNKCTSDMEFAIRGIALDVQAAGGQLYLSDLFRSYEMQLRSHLDWKTGRKKAFSPPPGASMHEAGRALDYDLGADNMGLDKFWVIAKKHGLTPIIATPKDGASESWHFDRRGSHDLVYQYYRSGKGKRLGLAAVKPYEAMAASAILSIGVKVDKLGNHQTVGAIQAALIRLGHDIGDIDGTMGPNTGRAIDQEITGPHLAPDELLSTLEDKLFDKFPNER